MNRLNVKQKFGLAMNLAVSASPLLDGRFTGRVAVNSLQQSQRAAEQNAPQTKLGVRALVASQVPETLTVAGATEVQNKCIVQGRIARIDDGYDDRGELITQLLLQMEGEIAPLPVRFQKSGANINSSEWLGAEVVVDGIYRTRSVASSSDALCYLPYLFVRNFNWSVQKLSSK